MINHTMVNADIEIKGANRTKRKYATFYFIIGIKKQMVIFVIKLKYENSTAIN